MTNIDLEYSQLYTTVSTESLNGVYFAAGRTVDAVAGFLSTIKNNLESSRSGISKTTANVTPHAQVLKLLNNFKYVDVGPILVYVPQGLAVPLLTYSQPLAKAQAITDNIVKDVLKPTHVWISTLLGDPTKLSSALALYSKTSLLSNMKKIDDVRFEMAKCFEQNEITQVPFKQAYKRNADFEEYASFVNTLVKRSDLVESKVILDNIDELSNLLDTLYNRITQQPDIYKMTTAVAEGLAETLYQVAKELEFVSAHKTMVQIACQCQIDTNAKLESNLAD